MLLTLSPSLHKPSIELQVLSTRGSMRWSPVREGRDLVWFHTAGQSILFHRNIGPFLNILHRTARCSCIRRLQKECRGVTYRAAVGKGEKLSLEKHH